MKNRQNNDYVTQSLRKVTAVLV